MASYRVFYNPDCQMYGVEKHAGSFWQQVLPPNGKGGRGGQSAYTYYKAVAERWLKEIEESELTDAGRLTAKLIEAGADRAQVIAIINGYGDPVDWSYHSLDSIVAEVWNSDLNSGDEPDGWIINEICRTFNVQEVSE